MAAPSLFGARSISANLTYISFRIDEPPGTSRFQAVALGRSFEAVHISNARFSATLIRITDLRDRGLPGSNLLFGQLLTLFPPFPRYRSTPEKAARAIMRVLTDAFRQRMR